ncbi:DUF938 domain-containing protein [Noviherbaspirillum saxi]|uniref:DUF938 domain-containing protein n=1 Tax=Noviherbaspirillum saxi TaxID=2320863 RepID=A0A3A3FPV9_9BURK|nr:DUF938 domain-containing protein [Noviherbaspirillum saxi]RJF98257.1 DUF938 domain-containing protein [Noviherbaspirillum saxi]
MTKLYSAACERNRDPILAVLRNVLTDVSQVLEIGSGTGQHAVYFGAALPHLIWQTSDLSENHPSIRAWISESGLSNVLPPLLVDAAGDEWPVSGFDVVFTANTCHIMSWDEVQSMFSRIGRLLPEAGLLCIYGPFNYDGRFTSSSNAQFDAQLRSQAAHRGIRDIEKINDLALANGLIATADHAMPANNRLLIWRKAAVAV